MRLLTFTNLYPSASRPRHGIFVEERLRQLVGTGAVQARVLALRPAPAAFFAARSVTARRHGIDVEYLDVPTLPLVTNWVDPWLWAKAAEPAVLRWRDQDGPEPILDAHFLYPDGVAAVLLGRRLGIPTVLTARGSDVNVKCENFVMRRAVRRAAADCNALITVSNALARRVTELGIRPPRLEVLANGVDLEKFQPRDRAAARAALGVDRRALLSVGHLVVEKGHGLAIEALAALPDACLMIAGEGPERSALEALARHHGVASRVRFLGLVAHEKLAEVYSAADVLVLASVREGMPNVVLEALACGTPVVATDVGGIAEIVTSPVAGALMRERTAAALREALGRLFAAQPERAATRSFAQRFAWRPIVDKQIALYRSVLRATTASAAAFAP